MIQNIPVLTYGRWSSLGQTTSEGIQDDLFDLHLASDWMQQLLGGQPVVDEHYKDNGKSASKKKSKRHDFHRLLRDIKLHHAGKPIVVVNLSRLSRLHPNDVFALLRLLRETGNDVVSIDDRKVYKGDTLVEMIELLIKADRNHQDARTIANNTLRGSMKSAASGCSHTRLVPFGMAKLVISELGVSTTYPRLHSINKGKRDKSYIVAGDDAEVEVLRWMYHTFATASVSIGWLCRQLNKHANPLIKCGPSGKGWITMTVANMLRQPAYNGWLTYGKTASGEHFRVGPGGDVIEASKHTALSPITVKSKYPPIIDDETYAAVQAKLARLKGSGSKCRVGSDGVGYILTGSVICGNCGKLMCASVRHKAISYRCHQGHKNSSLGCNFWSCREDELLPFVLSKLDKELIRRCASKPEPVATVNSDRERILAELASTDRAIVTIRGKILSNPAAADSLSDLLISLQSKRNELNHIKISVMQPDPTAAQRAYECWEVLVLPMLVAVKTGNLGEDNAAVAKLWLQDEIDRLFNYTLVSPSVLREQLQAAGLTIRLWFEEAEEGPKKWRVSHGQINMMVAGQPYSGTIETRVGCGYDSTTGRLCINFTGAEMYANVGGGQDWQPR